ncbi:pyruvate, phosphate dikinase [Gordonia terrae]
MQTDEVVSSSDDLVLRLDGSTVYSRHLVGGKAHGISKMRAAGYPVPPAFVVTVDACELYFQDSDALMTRIWPDVEAGIAWLEAESGHTFGHGSVPLLVSVRSGAPASMPGMMDTVLNLGINDEVEESLGRLVDPAFAADIHRRFRELFTHVVAPGDDRIPTSPAEQLRSAICAVFESWHSPRAIAYRKHHGLEGKMAGTAVTIQSMVFGNLDEESGTGVLFSRNPITGDRQPFGEWLPRGQGEDVVSGKFDPLPIDALADSLPDIHRQLMDLANALETANHDVQDIEFTVESSRLYLLQTRAAKRSARAALTLAVRLAHEGLISPDEALGRITPEQIDVLLTPVLTENAREAATVLATGLSACPGIGRGVVVGDSEDAEDAADEGRDVVLARTTTSPDDVGGMIAARAVITELGGSTSHAAVVSREMHTPCVVGCGAGSFAGLIGAEVTVDGSSGVVYEGILDVVLPSEDNDPDLAQMLAWAREKSQIEVVTAEGSRDPDSAVVVDHREPSSITAAVASGATRLASEHPLPVLLTLLRDKS